LEPSSSKFVNYPATFPNKLHLVDTNIQLSPTIQRGLLLGLNFVPFPRHQKKQASTILTAYAKDPKTNLQDVATIGGYKCFMDSHSTKLWSSPEQVAFREMVHHPQ
jgi:hypothetical protein